MSSAIGHRVRNAASKIAWGLRSAGAAPAAAGALRLAHLRLRQPRRASVRTRSGFELEFAYPSQMPTALVAFGDMIDPEYPLLRALANPSWVVVDVGAAIGQFTVFAATLPVATVHAFEPSSANVDTLRANLARNHCEGVVTVHRTALSDHDGTAAFTTTGEAMVSGVHRADPAGETEEVQLRRLDDELARLHLQHVDVLKINVAGYEAAVLDGASSFLESGGADVLVLLLGTESLSRYARLADHGYRFFYFHPRDRELHEVRRFDETALAGRPWPARHIVALHERAMARGLGADLPVR